MTDHASVQAVAENRRRRRADLIAAIPEELRRLMPGGSGSTTSQHEEAPYGLVALGRLVYDDQEQATWLCPDCGQPVVPVRFSARRWMPAAYCHCSGAVQRRERIELLRIDLNQADEQRRTRHQLLENCRLSANRVSGMDFHSWQTDTPARLRAAKMARRLAYRLLGGAWCFWTGPFGCGKTHLAFAIARYLVLEHGCPTTVVNWTRELGEITASWQAQRGDGREQNLLQRMAQARVLFLDDVDKTTRDGGARTSDWSLRLLYQVLDRRALADKATIIIANLDQVGFEHMLLASNAQTGQAVLSRMVRQGTLMIDWGKIGLQEWRPPAEQPLF